MTPSTVVSAAAPQKPVNITLRAVRGTQVEWTVTLEDEDGTNPNLTADTVEFTLSERQGGRSRLVVELAGGDPSNGVRLLTLTAAELTFNGLSDDQDEKWSYAIRRQIGASGANELVYIEGDFFLLTTASVGVPG